VDVPYCAPNLAHRGGKSIDRYLGSSSCLAFSVIAVWQASESIYPGKMALFDPLLASIQGIRLREIRKRPTHQSARWHSKTESAILHEWKMVYSHKSELNLIVRLEPAMN
jgi:hypothetical protein